MRKQAYSILVYNNPGLLSRMAGLFSRRGYNIESITAGTTADPRFTRITIVPVISAGHSKTMPVYKDHDRSKWR